MAENGGSTGARVAKSPFLRGTGLAQMFFLTGRSVIALYSAAMSAELYHQKNLINLYSYCPAGTLSGAGSAGLLGSGTGTSGRDW